MQPAAVGASDRPRCKLLPKHGFLPSTADVADPFVTVRLPLYPGPTSTLTRTPNPNPTSNPTPDPNPNPTPNPNPSPNPNPKPGAALRRAARRCRTLDGGGDAPYLLWLYLLLLHSLWVYVLWLAPQVTAGSSCHLFTIPSSLSITPGGARQGVQDARRLEERTAAALESAGRAARIAPGARPIAHRGA